jgi:hypothetical protein
MLQKQWSGLVLLGALVSALGGIQAVHAQSEGGPDGGGLDGPRDKEWYPPTDHCQQGDWSVCGEDNNTRNSQFDTCLAGYCLSCRLASESVSCPGVWEWCDQDSAPCMIPSGSWAN